jgi:hypothetical protein
MASGVNVPLFHGKVEKGRLVLEDSASYRKYIVGMEGKRVSMSVKKYREPRTDNSNRYYWGVVIETIAEHLGYDKDDLHDALKFKFLSSKCYDEKGLLMIGSTAKLTTDEFTQYINKIVIWAAQDLQIYVPDPGHTDY